jgi:hypothetical protein
MDKYYIYAHINSQHGVFYVGKGCAKRLYATSNRSDFWKRIVRKHGYALTILECGLSEKTAYEKEILYIAKYKSIGQCAANFTIGGDGVRVEKRWWNDAISKALTGKICPNGKDNKSYKDFADEETLREMYEVDKLSTTKIADIFNISIPTVCSRLVSYGIEVRSIYKRGKKIECIENGQVYDSITDAARKLDIYRENIRKVLSGKYLHTGGYSFKFKE